MYEIQSQPVETGDYQKTTFYNANNYDTDKSTFYVAADSQEDSEAHKVEPQTIDYYENGQSIVSTEDNINNVITPTTTIFNESGINRYFFFSLSPQTIREKTIFLLSYKCDAVIDKDCYIKLIPEDKIINGSTEITEKAKQIFEFAQKEITSDEDETVSAEYFPIDLYCAYTTKFITQSISCEKINQQKKKQNYKNV